MKKLCILILIGIVYTGWLYSQGTLTGVHRTDGIIGVVLGLYVCSHPAANFVEMLFFRRGIRNGSSPWDVASRFGLNLLVMLIGWMTVFVGAMRLIARGG